jgi:hypothetical protein
MLRLFLSGALVLAPNAEAALRIAVPVRATARPIAVKIAVPTTSIPLSLQPSSLHNLTHLPPSHNTPPSLNLGHPLISAVARQHTAPAIVTQSRAAQAPARRVLKSGPPGLQTRQTQTQAPKPATQQARSDTSLRTLVAAINQPVRNPQKALNRFFDSAKPQKGTALATHVGRQLSPLRSQLLHDTPTPTPEPAFTPAPVTKKNYRHGLAFYVTYLSLVQAGIGAYTPVWPEMAMERFGAADYGLAASLAVLAMPFAAYGGKWLAQHIGVKKGLAVSLFGASAALATLFTLFGLNSLPWIGLTIGLVGVQGLFASMRTLDKAIPAALLGPDQARLRTFNGLSFALSRIPGILVPLAAGTLVAWVGPFGTLAIFPLALLAAIPFILGLRTQHTSGEQAPTEGSGNKRLLHLAGLGFASQQIMTYVLPFILASGWGRYAFAGDPLAAKSAAGMLFGFWMLGSLLGTLTMMGAFKRITSRFLRLSSDPLRRAALIGALGFAGYLPLIFTAPWAVYAGMIPAGFGSAYAFLIYLSAAQAHAPAHNRAGAIARYMMFSFGVVAAAIWGLGTLIQVFPGSPLPFIILTAVLGGLALLNLAIGRAVKKKSPQI